MTWCVDDKETGNLELERTVLVDDSGLLADGIDREVCRTNLLRDTTGFTLLNIGLTNLVKELGLSSIDVTENTANW